MLRRSLLAAVDALIVLESLAVALLFRFDAQVPEEFWTRFWPFAVLSAAVFVVFLFGSGAYRNEMYRGARLAGATVIAAIVLIVANMGLDLVWARPVPLSVILVGGVLAFVQLVVVRLYPRVMSEPTR